MHELGIAEALLETICREAVRQGEVRVHKAVVKIGELAGVDGDALRFAFEAIVRGTEFEQLELEIEACPLRGRCADCGREFAVHDYDLHCPQCGSERGEFTGGDELDLAYLEVEEHAASGVGTESTQ